MRLRPLTEQVAVYFSKDEYEFILDCVPDRRTYLALRLEAESSPRLGTVTKIRRDDFFVPDDDDVEIAFLRIRGSKDTTEGESPLQGSARITWVPEDLYDCVMSYCDRNGIDDDEELFEIEYERLRQLIVETRKNAASRSGNDDYLHVTSHDFRRFYATHMIRRMRVEKALVMEMGDWNSHKAIEPYLAVSQPKDIQDGLARAGVVETDVPAPPRQDELDALYSELNTIKELLISEKITSIDGVDMDLLENLKADHESNATTESEEDTDTTELEQSTLPNDLNVPSGIKSYVPGAVIAVIATLVLSWRLEKELDEVTNGGADLAPPLKLAMGPLTALLFIVMLGIHMASSGIWLDPSTFTFHASSTEMVALVVGSALSILQTLWADYRVRVLPSQPF